MALLSASTFQQSLSGVSATGAGVVLDNGASKAFHGIIVTTGAGVSAGTVVLQGSHDGVNWFTTGASVSTTSASAVLSAAAVNFPYQYVRANVTVAITGGTISATVASA